MVLLATKLVHDVDHSDGGEGDNDDCGDNDWMMVMILVTSINLILNQTAVLYGCSLCVCVYASLCVYVIVCLCCMSICVYCHCYLYISSPLGLPGYIISIIFPLDLAA